MRIPGIYDGRNKTFFMFNYEGYKELTPNPVTYTVPDAAQLRGDFSNLRDAQGRLITIYDPNTGRLENGQWVRDPFPGNRIPAQPHRPGGADVWRSISCSRTAAPAGGDPWRNNFLFAPNLGDRRLPQHRDEGRPEHQHRTTRCSSATPTTSAPRRATPTASPAVPAQDGQLPLGRINHTGVADWVRVANSTLVFNVRGGLNQYLELARSDPGLGFNPAELGFPPSLVNQLPNQVFPRLNFYTRTTGTLPTPTGVEEYRQLGRNSRNRETTTGFSLQPNFSWTKSNHNVRGGLDMRMTWYTTREQQQPVRPELRPPLHAAAVQSGDALSGNAIASFLLGAARRRRHRQQLLPDVPVELLRALGPGRLARHRIA